MIKEKYIQTVKETAINIANSKVESIRLKNGTKTSLRIYKDGCIGVAGAIGSYDEAALTGEALDAIGQGIEYPWSPAGNLQQKISCKSSIFESDLLADEVEHLLAEMTEKHPDFIFSYKVILQEIETRMANDLALELEYDDAVISVEFVYKEKASTNIMDGFIQFQSREYNRSSVLYIVDHTLSAYRRKADLPKEGKLPVVFMESEIPVMKLLTDLNPRQYSSGSSLLSNKSGQKIFNECLTVYLSRNPEDEYNTPFFDAEGTINENFRYALIQNGVLTGPYTDKRTAGIYHLPLTGTAGASYDGVPELSPSGVKLEESEKTLKELLGGQAGIVVMVASGGDFTPEGDFASPVQLAMLFDGDRLVGRLPELQISSNLFDMFGKDFRGLGKDKLKLHAYSRFAVIDMNVTEV